MPVVFATGGSRFSTDAHDPLLAALIIAASATPMAINLTATATMAIASDLVASHATVAATFALYLALAAVGQAVFGPLSDLFGRRPVMLAGLSVYVAGALVCASAPNTAALALGRALLAAGCAGFVVSRAVVRDAYQGRTMRALALMCTGVAVVPIIAPIAGAVLVERAGWRAVFLALAAFGALALVLTSRIAETHTAAARSFSLPRYGADVATLLRLRGFWLRAGALATIAAPFLALVTKPDAVCAGGCPSVADSGLLVTAVSVGFLLGSFAAGSVRRWSPLAVTLGGAAVAAIGTLGAAALALAGVPGAAVMLAPLFLLGVGNGLALPPTLGGALALRPHLAGTAAGVLGTLQVGGGALASASVGVLADLPGFADTQWPVLTTMAASATLSLVLTVALVGGAWRPRRALDAGPEPRDRADPLLDRDRLREVARLVDVGPVDDRGVVREQLQRHG